MQKLHSESSIFIHTSKSEGCPNAILEAMSWSTPCIVLRFSGVEEIIMNNINGIIYQPDDVVSLANHILEVGSNKNCYELLARNALLTIENNFTEESRHSTLSRIITDMH